MKVLITDFGQEDTNLEREMLEQAGIEMVEAQCHTPEEVILAGENASALVVQEAPITSAVFEALPKLQIISTPYSGVDTIDLEAAKSHGVWVTNVPDANVIDVAMHTLAMALALIRHLPFYDRDVRAGKWHYLSTGHLRRPANMTLGIVGLGNIGRAFAKLAEPIFKQIVGYDPYLSASAWPNDVRQVELSELFQQSNVVSLHTPLTKETRGLVSSELLTELPVSSYLINVARGEVLDLEALLPLLEIGHIAGVGLDVLPEEPPRHDDPILHHPRVLISPHTAFYSIESEEELFRKSIINILTWARGDSPPYVVVEGKNLP